MTACKAGQYDQALDILDGLMELDGAALSNSQWGEVCLAAGYAHDRKGDRNRAIESYGLAAALAEPRTTAAMWAEKGLSAPLTQVPFTTSTRRTTTRRAAPFAQRPEDHFANLDADARRRTAEQNLQTVQTAPDGQTRWQAIEALGLLRDRRAVPHLSQFLNRRGAAMGFRQSWVAAKALGRIGDRAAVPHLIDALTSINVDTQRESRRALQKITGQNLQTQDEWRQWLAANQPPQQ